MDVSDGLAGDLAKMMRVSGVSAIVDTARLPLSPAVRRAVETSPDLMDLVVTGGDDYEILFTLPVSSLDRMRKEAEGVGVTVSVIGEVVAGFDLPVFRTKGFEKRYDVGSFSHF